MSRPRYEGTSLRWLALAGGVLAGGAALAVIGTRQRYPMPAPKAPERSRIALINGIPMRWEQHGGGLKQGIPVVLVHGLPTNPRAWRYVIPRVLRPGVCCLAWELVGFGRSLPVGMERDLSIPAQASYLRSWLRHLGIRRAIFVGHDYGGGVLQHLATTSPDLFAGLVLTDCVAFDNWPVAAVRTARALRSVIPGLPLSVVRLLFRAALANLGHENSSVAAESADLFWQPYANRIGPDALAHQLSFFDNEDTRRAGRHLIPLGCPTTVVWGERDPLGLPSARNLAARLNADLFVIPDAYHFTPEDHPEVIAGILRRTIERAEIRPPHMRFVQALAALP